MKTSHRLLPALLSLVLVPAASLAQEIDWNKAKLLNQKKRQGQALSPDETAYLNKAIEARQQGSHRATRGDGTNEKATVPPIRISEDQSPVRSLSVTASDGHQIDVAYRSPRSERPLPAMIFFHGGLGLRRLPDLQASARTNPTHTRFLNAGFVSVSASFRTYGETPQSRGPILDAIAIVQAIAKLPEVDPKKIIIFGGSGGGSIALQLASEKDISPLAVVAGEPATVLYTGVMTSISNRESSMKEYPTLYNDTLRKKTEAKIGNISCPILVHHGDKHALQGINFDLVFPAIKAAGKTIQINHYPGEQHGFYWGNHTTTPTLEKVVASTLEFLQPLLTANP